MLQAVTYEKSKYSSLDVHRTQDKYIDRRNASVSICTNQQVWLAFFCFTSTSSCHFSYTPKDRVPSRLFRLFLVWKDIWCLLTYYLRWKTTSIITKKRKKSVCVYICEQEMRAKKKTRELIMKGGVLCAKRSYERKVAERKTFSIWHLFFFSTACKVIKNPSFVYI